MAGIYVVNPLAVVSPHIFSLLIQTGQSLQFRMPFPSYSSLMLSCQKWCHYRDKWSIAVAHGYSVIPQPLHTLITTHLSTHHGASMLWTICHSEAISFQLRRLHHTQTSAVINLLRSVTAEHGRDKLPAAADTRNTSYLKIKWPFLQQLIRISFAIAIQ